MPESAGLHYWRGRCTVLQVLALIPYIRRYALLICLFTRQEYVFNIQNLNGVVQFYPLLKIGFLLVMVI